jgi:cell division protein ZapB
MPALAILAGMDTEFETLESRFAALIARIHELDGQNERMAVVLAEVLKENAELKFCVAETRLRVETLISRLPGEPENE